MKKDYSTLKNCILDKCKSYQKYNKFNYRLAERSSEMFMLELSTGQRFVYIQIKAIIGGVKVEDRLMSLPTFYVYLLDKVKNLCQKEWTPNEKQEFWWQIHKYLAKIKREYASEGLELNSEPDNIVCEGASVKVSLKLGSYEKSIIIKNLNKPEIDNPSAYFAHDKHKQYDSIQGTKLGIKAVVREFMFDALKMCTNK